MSRWQTIIAIDADKWACRCYKANFPDALVVQALVGTIPLPAADVILAGPPCQSFSTAGKGKGDEDERNSWPETIEAIRQVQPRMFLCENVPGMLAARHMPYTRSVHRDLEAAGYVVATRLLDAVNFGAPQFRKRLWWWGIRRDVYESGVRHIWPKPTHQWPWPEPGMFGDHGLLPAVTVGQALGIDSETVLTHTRNPETTGAGSPFFTAAAAAARTVSGNPHGIVGVQRLTGKGAQHTKPVHPTGEPSLSITDAAGTHSGVGVHEYRWSPAMREKHPPQQPQQPQQPSDTVHSKWFKGGAEGLVEVAADPKHPVQRENAPAVALVSGGKGHGPTESYLKLAVDGRTWDSRHPVPGPEEPMTTVRPRSPRDDGRCTEQVVNDGLLVRRLTPAECARLQSCPDDMAWPAGIPKTAQYRIIGNGWNCAIASALSRALAEADPESRTVIDLFCGGGLGALGWHGRAWHYSGSAAGGNHDSRL